MELNAADPLAVARLFLKLTPNEDDRRALPELLQALIDGATAKPLRDSRLFQGELGKLTAALLDARAGRMYSDEQWRHAAGC